MKSKFIYILVVAGFSVGSFFLGWYMHPKDITTPVEPGISYSDVYVSYFSLVPKECHKGNTPGDYACVAGLAGIVISEADELSTKLLKTSPETDNPYMHEGYYENLHEYLQLVRNNKNAYLDSFCELDGMLVYGGTGIMSEIASCRYYYARQYLNILKIIDQDIEK